MLVPCSCDQNALGCRSNTHCITVKQGKFAINKLKPENRILQMIYYMLLSTHSLASGEESDIPACCPPANISVHLASRAVTSAGSGHKSRGDNMVRMWLAFEEMMCVVYVSVTKGHSGDGCDLAPNLGKYDMRKGN